MKLFSATLIGLLLSAAPLIAQEGPQQKAEQLLDRVAKRPDKAWDYAFGLRGLTKGPDGGKVTPVLEKGLDNDSEAVRLVCARLLFVLNAPDAATETLAKLLRSEDDRIIEAAAMLVADESPKSDEINDKLRQCWEGSQKRAAGARVALCEAMFVVTGETLPRDQLHEFLASGDHELVARAALALSDMGQAAGVQARVAAVAKEPGDLGRLARLGRVVADTNQAAEDVKSGKVGVVPDGLIVAEIRTLQKHYVDDHFFYGEQKQTSNAENLVDNACRAMATAFDRYGGFMTKAEYDGTNEDRYPGIGAHVAQGEDGIIYITQPIYEGPAYKAGIRTGDKLVGVDDTEGKRIDLTKMLMDDGVKLVRGPVGSKVKIYIRRRGVDRELTFEIIRAEVKLDTALEEMLPGQVGYIRLTRFGLYSGEDTKDALNNLRKQGMEYLILDLRGNGGGAMSAVLDIADALLPKGKLISTTAGRARDEKAETIYSRGGSFSEVPLVVLIDNDSASGSEMLSGALKDNNRALVIGRTSFGKGVGQRFFTVEQTNASRVLKTTVFEYKLPSGASIDRKVGVGGVTPNIEIAPQYLEAWEVYSINKLRKSGKLEDYLDLNYRGEAKAALMKLAAFDGLNAGSWPAFEDFYKSLNTKLDRDDVRRELRFALRTRVQDDRGAEFTQNYQEDPALLRGVKELMTKAEKDPAAIPEYKTVMK